jgi:hypothetical protein
MSRTKWFSIRVLDVDTKRFTSGRWCIERNEVATRVHVKSPGGEFFHWVKPGLSLHAYRRAADQIVVDLTRGR